MRSTKTELTIFMLPFLFVSTVAQQTGGNFTVTQTVIAAGGNTSTNGIPTVEGTIGQMAAGAVASGGQFSAVTGFWNFTPSSPTAASVSVSGQVLTADGAGIRNAMVTITSANGSTKMAISSTFGYYRFDDVTTGETYVISVSTKRFTFSRPSNIIAVLDNVVGVDFVAEQLP
jgi:hypothetical protein